MPQRTVIKAEYSTKEVDAIVDTLTSVQILDALYSLAIKAAEFEDTKELGAELFQLYERFEVVEKEADTETEDNQVRDEIKSLISLPAPIAA